MPATIRRLIVLALWAVVPLLTPAPTAAQSIKPAPIPVTIPLPGGIVLRFDIPAPAGPDAVLLTPARYRELLDQIEKLKADLAARQPHKPRACELEGRVEQRGQTAVLKLKAVFKYTAPEPKAVIFLGCQKAHVIEARLEDGKVPLLTAAEDGLRVQADTVGEHVLRLDLEVAVGPRGQKGDLGFDLGLPGAPITVLTFEPPTGVRRLTLVTRVPKPAALLAPEMETEQTEAERFQPGKGGAPLGPVTSLGLNWEDPQKKSAVVRSAETEIVASISPDEVVTEARLRLRGGAADWRFTAPAAADVTIGPWPGPGPAKGPTEFPADRAPVLTRPEPGQSVWGLRFRDPPAGDVLVTVTVRAPRPKSGPMSVGPFAVLDTPHQVGSIRLRTPLGWRAATTLKGDVRRDPDGANGEATFRYTPAAPLKTPVPDPPLTFTLAASPGVVTTRSRTDLRLGERGWHLRTEVAVSPSRAEVEVLEFEAPAGFTPTRAEPREIVEGVSAARDLPDGRKVYHVRLNSPKRAAFAFTVDGEYAASVAAGRAALTLPRWLGVTERAAEIVATAPPRFDVGGEFRVWEGAKAGTWETPLDVEPAEKESRARGSADRPIAVVALRWPVATGGVAVQSTSDVTIEAGGMRVDQRLAYTFAGRAPTRVRLLAREPVGTVRVSRGAIESVADGWDLVVPPDAGRDWTVALTYVVRRPTTTLPVLTPETPDSVQTVRVWDTSGRDLEAAADPQWAVVPVEPVPDRPVLPGLVLRARGPVPPPAMRIGPDPEGGGAGPVVLRAAIEVRAVGDSALCRARFWVTSWGRVPELLIPAAARGAEVYLAGKRVPASDANTTSIRLPVAPASPGGVVEVRYRVPWRPEYYFQPPGFARADLLGEVAWSIWPPAGRVPLALGAGTADWSPTAFLTTLGLGRWVSASGVEADAGPVTITHRGDSPARLWLVPRHLWVLGCSVVAFVVALGYAAAPPRGRTGLLVLGLVAGTGLAIWMPQPVSRAVFGFIPGLLAAAVTLLGFQAVRGRYRARAARESGFARQASTQNRPSSLRPRGPTTASLSPFPSSSRSGP